MRLHLLAPLTLLAATTFPIAAQTWDNSGNSMLQGTYYFREVAWIVDTSYDVYGESAALFGNITFDGAGNYTITNTLITDNTAGAQINFGTKSGTYAISSSGFGYISSPLSTGDSIFGLVSKGVFIASSTEAGFNDLFIAAPLASPAPTQASFKGTYTFVQLDTPTVYPEDSRNCTFQMSPDGTGNIGTVRVTGNIAGYSQITQNISGVRYSFSNGAAVVYLGGQLTTSNLIAGNKYLYFSPDGSFVFGGSPNGFDMIIGVQSATTSPTFDGLYYQAGVYQDNSQISSGYEDLNTYHGSFKATSGNLLAHQRLYSVFSNNGTPYDYMYSAAYTLSNGSYTDSFGQYFFGAGGAIRIGVGNAAATGVNVAIQAPSFTPSGVYIYPTGVVNAGSSAWFTSGVAPGELITIYGSNLAPTVASDSTFPFQLNGVQVMVNNRPAPIYYVSPGQVSAMVPFGTTEIAASIQVINNGEKSNTVSSWVNLTSPGAFTNPPGGTGYTAALHPDYSVVSPSKPAQPGETVSVYVTGLGDVSPAVADGAPGPTSPFSTTTNTLTIYIGGTAAATSFVGLAPGLVGLYQINVQIPSTLTTGNQSFAIASPDFYITEAWIPVGAAATTNVAPAPEIHKPMTMGRGVSRRRFL